MAFLKKKERTMKNSIHIMRKKIIRDGRMLASISDILLSVKNHYQENTPQVILEAYGMLNEHFDREFSILKERKEKLLTSRDS